MYYFFTLLLLSLELCGAPFPIQFGIPENRIVKEIPEKTQDFAYVTPYDRNTYIFEKEADYYQDYQRSYYAVTCKKAGWDALRHYEILANGTIPYFTDLAQAPADSMIFLPRELILEAMHLEGVSHGHIDHEKFDKKRYFEILEQLLEHTRAHLTTKKMAQYVLDSIGYKGSGNILFISGCLWPDYMRCLLLTGFKDLYQERIVDYPKVHHVYKSYPEAAILGLYGKGMSYTRTVEDLPVDRENIEERIKKREFDLIVYGSIHRGNGFLDLVKEHYLPEEIVYICGEDIHGCQHLHNHNLFLREFDWNRELITK